MQKWEPQPLNAESLREQFGSILDLFRSKKTGELFELYDILDDGTALLFHVGTMTPATMPYGEFRDNVFPAQPYTPRSQG